MLQHSFSWENYCIEILTHVKQVQLARLNFFIFFFKCNWVPRKDENNPKTIEQIHKEAQQEQQEKLLLLQTVTIPNQKPTRGGGRGGNKS